MYVLLFTEIKVNIIDILTLYYHFFNIYCKKSWIILLKYSILNLDIQTWFENHVITNYLSYLCLFVHVQLFVKFHCWIQRLRLNFRLWFWPESRPRWLESGWGKRGVYPPWCRDVYFRFGKYDTGTCMQTEIQMRTAGKNEIKIIKREGFYIFNSQFWRKQTI